MYNREHHERIQAKLWELVNWMKPNIPDQSFGQIVEYIELNELGLALDNIILVLDEHSITVPSNLAGTISDLIKQIGTG